MVMSSNSLICSIAVSDLLIILSSVLMFNLNIKIFNILISQLFAFASVNVCFGSFLTYLFEQMEYSYNTLLISCVLILVSSGSLSIDWLFSLWVMLSCCFACLIIKKKVFICFYSAAPGPGCGVGILSCGVGILSCGVGILSCSMWDLVLWPGPLHWEHGVIAAEPLGKSHAW